MANTLAPKNFNILSDINLSLYQIKCQLCSSRRKVFHCVDCIRNGDFLHTTNRHFSERFAEKQLKYLQQKSTHRTFEEKVCKILEKKKIEENLRLNINNKKERIRILRKLISDAKNGLTKENEKKKILRDSNENKKKMLPKYEDKVRKLEDYVLSKIEDNDKKRDEYQKQEIELKILVRSSINKLIKYIFPIYKEIGRLDLQNTEISELERALAEATRNIYARERGSFQDSQNDVQHVIVAPSLPGNGDYSAYSDWVMNNKDGLPSTTTTTIDNPSRTNPAFRISAALTFTAQLIQVISSFLDVRLPYKMIYSDFCSSTMTVEQITRRVARLNANILYLCYTQCVKLSNLQPIQTLENVLQLLDLEKCDLGRLGPVELSDVLNGNMESQLVQDLEFGDESASEDENNFSQDWEAVPHASPLEAALPPPIHHPHYHQHQASMAGGLMTSAAHSIVSIWRGWTTGR